MPHTPDHFADADRPDERLVREIIARFEASADRLRNMVIEPPGRSGAAREWNQARAAQILSQVNREIERLKGTASTWTGQALTAAMRDGIATADRQAEEAGVQPLPGVDNAPLQGTFAGVDRRVVEVFAGDTVGDLHKAADSVRSHMQITLRRMAAEGVSNEQVNAILTGGMIEGKPVAAIRELRDALRKIHGLKVVIQTTAGPRDYDVGKYARMVAVTKMREAKRHARHSRLIDKGINLVTIVGRRSTNPCTAYLAKIYSIAGKHPRYPSIDVLPFGGPPFHPNCTKSTAPFIEALADPEELAAGEPDPDTSSLHVTPGSRGNAADLQRKFNSLKLGQQVEARLDTIATAYDDRARRVGAILPHELRDTVEADTWADRRYGRWADQVRRDDDARSAVQQYQRDSTAINDALRGRGPMTPDVQRQIDALSKAIQSAPPLDRDTFVFRGTDWPPWHALAEKFRQRLDARWEGIVLPDQAFMSASITPDSAFTWMDKRRRDHPVFVRIILPKGTRAAWVDGLTDAGDAELVLPPGGELVVTQAITRRRRGQPHTYLTARWQHAR